MAEILALWIEIDGTKYSMPAMRVVSSNMFRTKADSDHPCGYPAQKRKSTKQTHDERKLE